MSTRHVRIIVSAGLFFIALVVGISLLISYRLQRTTYTELPDTSAGASAGPETTGEGSISNNYGLSDVDVGVGNVQAVIDMLSRQESYTRSIHIESFYNGGNVTYDFDITISGDDSAIRITGPGPRKYIIVADGLLYIWYEGDKEYRSGPSGALGDGRELSDELQMLLTYEDVLKLDKKNIRIAGFDSYGSENCIFVEFVTDDVFSYATVCYISVASGLLVGAEQYDGGNLIYRMTSSELSATVNTDAFMLPDGNNALSAP